VKMKLATYALLITSFLTSVDAKEEVLNAAICDNTAVNGIKIQTKIKCEMIQDGLIAVEPNTGVGAIKLDYGSVQFCNCMRKMQCKVHFKNKSNFAVDIKKNSKFTLNNEEIGYKPENKKTGQKYEYHGVSIQSNQAHPVIFTKNIDVCRKDTYKVEAVFKAKTTGVPGEDAEHHGCVAFSEFSVEKGEEQCDLDAVPGTPSKKSKSPSATKSPSTKKTKSPSARASPSPSIRTRRTIRG